MLSACDLSQALANLVCTIVPKPNYSISPIKRQNYSRIDNARAAMASSISNWLRFLIKA